jgi:uncharacterized protein YyaL (SSP411 family)
VKRKIVFLLIMICFPLAVIGLCRGSALSNVLDDDIASVSSSPERYNRLIHEKSPYLLQHADNAIYWYPWGEEAFSAARAENKPIFLSIGYSTCHWCHVLEKESFENQEVADLLNRNYISIKVDREENPDVDKFYMSIVQAMTGGGGWPMTVVMTPDLIPFFGGTYFPRDQLIKILKALDSAWDNQPEKIKSVGEDVSRFIEASNNISAGTASLNEDIFKIFYKRMVTIFDPKNGGFGRAPKFPSTMKLRVLLRIAHRTGSEKSLAMVESSLEHMARGGMYDHLGGGFHRYSTDRIWLVPHFEKMLYDQAALSLVYLEGYQLTQNKMFESVARGILDYVLKDMTGLKGGFYSAEDADSEGEEGTFYVWSGKELKKNLTQAEYKRAEKVYGVSSKGNFGDLGKRASILHLQKGIPWEVKADPAIQLIHKKLLSVREKRVRPIKDDKILTAWNGLMLGSMAKAYQVLGDEKYLVAAQKAAEFIKSHLYQNEKLARRFRAGEVKHTATLDDYAYLIQGLMALYEADFDVRWIHWARKLQEKQDDLFWDADSGAYYYSEKLGNFLPVRNKGFNDSARPNSNAVTALNLLKLFNFTFKDDYINKSRKILSVSSSSMIKAPEAFTQMLIALDFYLDRSKEIAVVGPADSLETEAILKTLRARFVPNKTLAYSQPNTKALLPILEDKVTAEGKTTVYVCENNVCQFPTGDLIKIQELVFDNKKYTLN